MVITFKGKSKKTSEKLCRKAIEFYAKKLIHPRTIKNLDIKIKFKPYKKVEADGWCEWVDQSNRPKMYTITVDNSLSRKKTLLALAHEMVHVKQYASGEMKDMAKTNTVKWRNETFPRDGVYWEHPWEIEAYGRELGLYMMFMSEED